MKPLNCKNYGSIPHLIGSKLGEGDRHIHKGQHDIITKKPRDKHDIIIVTEKYDGSNVGVCKVNDKIHAITRSGYLASSSQYEQHLYFDEYVKRHYKRFNSILKEGDRICGEWILGLHSLKYGIESKDPFIAFDIFSGGKRKNSNALYNACIFGKIQLPRLISLGGVISIDESLEKLYDNKNTPIYTEKPEGFIVRVERKGKFDFMAKYVRKDFEPGKYLNENLYNMNPLKII